MHFATKNVGKKPRHGVAARARKRLSRNKMAVARET
jgi:hypothetical protein